jgi:hypothetical protein
MPRPRHTDSI